MGAGGGAFSHDTGPKVVSWTLLFIDQLLRKSKQQAGNAFGSQFPLVTVILLVFSALQHVWQYTASIPASQWSHGHVMEPQSLATPSSDSSLSNMIGRETVDSESDRADLEGQKAL